MRQLEVEDGTIAKAGQFVVRGAIFALGGLLVAFDRDGAEMRVMGEGCFLLLCRPATLAMTKGDGPYYPAACIGYRMGP